MSAKETHKTEVQTTTQYWGYRELTADEIHYVGGGDDGGDGGGGDSGGGDSGGGGDYGDGGDYGGGYSDAGLSSDYGSQIADSGPSFNSMEGATSGGSSLAGTGSPVGDLSTSHLGVESCRASEFAGPSTAAQTAEANASGPGSWGNTASWGIGAIVGANLAFGNAPGVVAAGAYGLFGALTQDRPGAPGAPANLSDIAAP
jgi:hypothetical protein